MNLLKLDDAQALLYTLQNSDIIVLADLICSYVNIQQ